MSKISLYFSAFILIFFNACTTQQQPKITSSTKSDEEKWVNNTYNSLSQDEKLGQLFIVALYTNKGEDYITNVRKLVTDEKLGGLILMQDDAVRETDLVNEFQAKSKVPMLIGMDAEWGVYQRIPVAHKFPWAMTLGAIQDKTLITEMAAKIAEDCKLMGINWDFAPVVDVNTNPNNPIIGNRSFGSDVDNVIRSATAYKNGLQNSGVLAAMKHFPGHGDTSTDSHLDIPVVPHTIERLNLVELAPFKAMMNSGIGGVMVAHLYVPALEPQQGLPASVSKNIITGLLKEKLGFKGLIITDALNMGAVAKHYKPGELDALAFKAGNDIMLFSEGVNEGKRLIQVAIDKGELSQNRVEESVKKILRTKYKLGLNHYLPKNSAGINAKLNTPEHSALAVKLYSNAITLLKNEDNLLPLQSSKNYYYLPLEEAPYSTFTQELGKNVTVIKKETINKIPNGATVIIGLHKDNSTAYKPYIISAESKELIAKLATTNKVVLNVFGSPYALKYINLNGIKAVVISYENNDDSMNATAKALYGKAKISGRLPVLVNENLKAGIGMNLEKN